ncbi:MAG: exodeoxyribonuclease VII small subunit [Deltaproteobacteria bacterium]|nr:exodeoxyribonuclease VII small subunit [Deltaproteobacteria bacterium]
MKPEQPSALLFEDAMRELEARVRELEGGNLTLDQSIAVFEAGTQLARQCEMRLAEAKGKVEILLKQANGEVAAEPFTATESER